MNKFLNLLWVLVAMTACISLASCSDDDDEPANSILGTWTLQESNDPGWADGLFDVITFKANNVFVRPVDPEDPGESYTDRYYVKGNTLRIDFNIEDGEIDDFSYGTFTISGDLLTYTFDWYSRGDDVPGESEPNNDKPIKLVLKKK